MTTNPTNRWTDSFALDGRALALFRVGLAAAIILDVLDRSSSLDMYGARGPTSPTSLGWTPSLHLLVDGELWTAIIFGLTVMASVALMVGFRTRTAAAASLILVLSTQVRLPLVSFGGDQLVAVLLLLAIIVPSGARWSVDSRFDRSTARFTSPGCVALFLQPVALHLGSALYKLHDVGWREGKVLGPLLTDHLHSTVWGEQFAAAFPQALPTLTLVALATEMVAPLVLLFPYRTARAVGIAGLIAVQVGMALFLDAGLFQLLSIVSVLPTLPGREECQLSSESSRWRHWLGGVVLTMITTTSVLHPVVDFHWGPLDAPLNILGLDQHWLMFANTAGLPRGWFYVIAIRPDGSSVDLWTAGRATGERPPLPFPTYAGFRLRRLWEGQLYADAATLKDDIHRWQCARATIAVGPVVAVRAWFADVTHTDEPSYVTLLDGPCP
jgi:hypothetical protein